MLKEVPNSPSVYIVSNTLWAEARRPTPYVVGILPDENAFGFYETKNTSTSTPYQLLFSYTAIERSDKKSMVN